MSQSRGGGIILFNVELDVINELLITIQLARQPLLVLTELNKLVFVAKFKIT